LLRELSLQRPVDKYEALALLRLESVIEHHGSLLRTVYRVLARSALPSPAFDRVRTREDVLHAVGAAHLGQGARLDQMLTTDLSQSQTESQTEAPHADPSL